MIQGKSALITGSSRGIGLAVAERLAAGGCNVVLNGIEDDAEGNALAHNLTARFGVRASFDSADVGDTAQVERLVGRAIETFGGVDILVNNAVTRVFGLVEETPPADWDHALAVNLSSAYNTIRLCLPGMKARNWGRIINMSSIYGQRGAPGRVTYVTAKTALIGLSRAVAAECTDFDITCNALCPGATETPAAVGRIEASMAADGIDRDEATKRFLAGKNPTGAFITSESVAEYCTFLCGPAGGDINGAVLAMDAGWSGGS
ncbi:MAG: SDR family oxidoreductase [Rhodospirillaceae bacterium]